MKTKKVNISSIIGQEGTDKIKDRMLVALVKRAGGKLDIPVSELDETDGYMMALRVNSEDEVFGIEVIKEE